MELLTMRAAGGPDIELKRYHGLVNLNTDLCDPERSVKYLDRYTYKPGDVFICSYPKSGTHWIGRMAWKLNTLRDGACPTVSLLEFRGTEAFDTEDALRIIFTHVRPSQLPKEFIQNNGKVVLMLRNPKDVCVSYYYHMKNSIIQGKQTWDEMFPYFLAGVCPFSSVFEYLKEWADILQDKQEGKIKIIVEPFYYEDFQINQRSNLERLNTYLGFERDEEYLEKVMQDTSFQSMKALDMSSLDKLEDLVKNEENQSIIYRKGKVGDWKNHFTVAQSEKVDAIMEDILKNGEIKFKYGI